MDNLGDSIVDKLFNSSWLCLISKECLSLLDPVIPEDINTSTYNPSSSGSIAHISGVIRTENSTNDEGIIQMLYGMNKTTVDMEANITGNLIQAENAYLSTATIAELMFLNASLILEKPTDSVAMHSDIGQYLKQVEMRKIYEPHYVPPPEQDMAAFQKLFNMLEGMTNDYLEEGRGESALAKLTALISRTTSGDIETNTNKVNLDGKENNAILGLSFKTSKNPYSF